jgi:hypothetical protein
MEHSALLKTRPESAWVLAMPTPETTSSGLSGWPFAPNTRALTPTFPPCPTESRCPVFSHGDSATVPVATLAPRHQPVHSRPKQAQEAVRSVAAGFIHLGLVDPHLNCFGQLNVRVAAPLHEGYTKQDPPPRHIKPIPLPLLHEVYHVAVLAGDSLSLATADMGYIGFFHLLRPGKYCLSSDSTPFRICDIQLRIAGNIVLNLTMTCSFDTLNHATCAQLEFTDQK